MVIKMGKAILICSWAKKSFYFKSFNLFWQWGYRDIVSDCHLSEASEVKLMTSFVFSDGEIA